MSKVGALPPGPNVGTQLKALRRARARRSLVLADDGAAAAATATGTGQPAGAGAVAPVGAAQRPFSPVASAVARDAEAWFAAQGWQPFAFQREVWAHMLAGRSGLLHATTGAGKGSGFWCNMNGLCYFGRGCGQG